MRLFRKELKRILCTRSTMAFLAAALGLSIFTAWLPVTFERFTYEENGREITVKGREALAAIKEIQQPNAGEVTPEKMAEGLKAYQKNLEIYGDFYHEDFSKNVYNAEILPWSPLAAKLREVMADPDSGLAADYTEITGADALSFYERCAVHLADLMKMEQKKNPAAQKTAANLYKKVETPFYYYPGYGTNMAEYEGICLFLLVFLCAMITAPVFSAEYQTGADDILRCTRLGRKQLALVKIAAAFCISIGTFGICMAIFLFLSNSLFGWECTRTSLQILFSAVTLADLNVGQMQLVVMLAGFFTLLATVSMVLLLSAACRTTTFSVGAAIALCLLPSFLYIMVGGALVSWLRILIPTGGVGGPNAFLYSLTGMAGFEFLNIGPAAFWTPQLQLIAPLLEIPVFLFFTVKIYSGRSR